MANNLFQNDNITANSQLGFEFSGIFKDEEEVLINKLKDVLNRDVTFSNVKYKLLEPTDNNAVLIKDGKSYIVKTPMYSYFEALYILPKLLDYLGDLKEFKNSYFYIKIGFNKDYIDLNQLNITKFILNFNEKFVLSKLSDITADGTIEKISNIKPKDIESCSELIQKQIENLKFVEDEDDIYGINFSDIKLGFVKFKYARDMNYRRKWEDIMKCINHTIICLSNATVYNDLDDKEIEEVNKMNKEFGDFATAFGCYEMFEAKYKTIKLTVDLCNDKSIIDMIFPSIKETLFNIIISNNIKNATINYDTDVSRMQLKDVELKKCYHLKNIDIVDSEVENCCLTECDLYDTKINNSKIIKSNLFGYANCKDSKFKNCFVSRNIQLTDCDVYGELGKFAGVLKSGTLKNTTILIDMAEISDKVEKDNVNEMK